VRPHEVDLQLADIVGGDAHVAQLPNASGYSIAHPVVLHQVFDHGAGAIDRKAGLGFQHYRTPLMHDRADILEGQIVAIDVKYFHALSICCAPCHSAARGCNSLPKKLLSAMF
jgi:hypothetical protein